MIYTLTLNPSIDYHVSLDKLVIHGLNRISEEKMYPGGKGINVSLVLKNLGQNSIALGFIAGFTGKEIERILEEKGIATDFIMLNEGNSRINVKVREDSFPETEINGCGPEISNWYYNLLLEKIEKLTEEDTLVIAGAAPKSLPEDIYDRIIDIAANSKVRVVLDTSGEQLKRAVAKGPFLVKPNNHELGELFGVTIETREQAIEYAKKLQDKGAKNVCVSLGKDGAVFVSEDGECFKTEAPKGKVINAIGAGDSLVAGFLSGLEETENYKKAFLMGVCAGSASAFSEGMATREQIDVLMTQISCEN